MSDSTAYRRTVGLCAECRFAQSIRGANSLFWLCGRARDDPAFARYPRLPVLACRGFESAADRASTEKPDRREER